MTKAMTTTISGRVKVHEQEEQVGRPVVPMDTIGLVVVVEEGRGIPLVGVAPNEDWVERIEEEAVVGTTKSVETKKKLNRLILVFNSTMLAM